MCDVRALLWAYNDTTTGELIHASACVIDASTSVPVTITLRHDAQ